MYDNQKKWYIREYYNDIEALGDCHWRIVQLQENYKGKLRCRQTRVVLKYIRVILFGFPLFKLRLAQELAWTKGTKEGYYPRQYVNNLDSF